MTFVVHFIAMYVSILSARVREFSNTVIIISRQAHYAIAVRQ